MFKFYSMVACILVLEGTTAYAKWENPSAVLRAAETGFENHFGQSVDIGKRFAVVGAPDATSGGAAYVFKKDENGKWVEMGPLPKQLPNIAPAVLYVNKFGYSVALAESQADSIFPDMIAVGAPGSVINDGGDLVQTGTVCTYAFDTEAQVWQPTQDCFYKSSTSDNNFGFSVGLSNYVEEGSFGGTTFKFSVAKLAVGDPLDDTNATDAGAVYLYNYTNNNWDIERSIYQPDGADTDDEFGYAVSVSKNHVMVGVPKKDISILVDIDPDCMFNPDDCDYITYTDVGAAFIFNNDGDMECGMSAHINSSYTNNQKYGLSVDLQKDDKQPFIRYIAGEALNSTGSDGGIHLGRCTLGGDTFPDYQMEFDNPNSSNTQFGYSVSIGDRYAVVGAPDADYNTEGGVTLSNIGMVVTYAMHENERWQEESLYYGQEGGELLGTSVSIAPDERIIVGSPGGWGGANVMEYKPPFTPAPVIMYLLQ